MDSLPFCMGVNDAKQHRKRVRYAAGSSFGGIANHGDLEQRLDEFMAKVRSAGPRDPPASENPRDRLGWSYH